MATDGWTAVPDASGTRRGPSGANAPRLRRGVAGAAGFVLLWSVVAAGYPSYLLPAPTAVLAAFVAELTTPVSYSLPAVGIEIRAGRMLVSVLQSLQHYLPGLAFGVAFGAPLGVAMGWSRLLDDLLTPVVRLLRPLPPLAWMGFTVVWIGIGHGGATFLVAIGAFWITFFDAYGGVEALPTAFLETGAVLGVDDDLTMLRKVVLPGVAPSVFTGVRTSIGQCWMIVVAAELFGAPGLGYRIIDAAQGLAMDVSVAYMLAISLLYLASDAGFRAFRRRVVTW